MLIKTNDPCNKQGYDFLIYSPLGRKKPYPVTFYYSSWYHLGYDRDEDTVYLANRFPEVENYDSKEEEPRPDSPESIQEADDLDRTIRNSPIDPTTRSPKAAHDQPYPTDAVLTNPDTTIFSRQLHSVDNTLKKQPRTTNTMSTTATTTAATATAAPVITAATAAASAAAPDPLTAQRVADAMRRALN